MKGDAAMKKPIHTCTPSALSRKASVSFHKDTNLRYSPTIHRSTTLCRLRTRLGTQQIVKETIPDLFQGTFFRRLGEFTSSTGHGVSEDVIIDHGSGVVMYLCHIRHVVRDVGRIGADFGTMHRRVLGEPFGFGER